MNWKETLTTFTDDLDDHFDQLRYHFTQRIDKSAEPYYIQPYRWYGTRTQFTVRGRVLQPNGLRSVEDRDSWWDNLLNTYRRFNSDEVPHAELLASWQNVSVQTTTDHEGYFKVELPLLNLPRPSLTHQVELQLLAPRIDITAYAELFVPPPSAEFGIISDIDDTILQTNAPNLLKAAQLTLLGNAKTRLPFAGVSELYQALQVGRSHTPQNPIFYVSSSPWNLYDLFVDFMTLHNIPAGPLCLRDLGFEEEQLVSSSHSEHKRKEIKQILATYPELSFVLLGDSGQHDPEIYAQLAQEHPHQLRAIYIRDVTESERDEAVERIGRQVEAIGIPMRYVPDSATALRHAQSIGLVQ